MPGMVCCSLTEFDPLKHCFSWLQAHLEAAWPAQKAANAIYWWLGDRLCLDCGGGIQVTLPATPGLSSH